MLEQSQSRIDQIKKKLYSKNAKAVDAVGRRHPLKWENFKAPTDWDSGETEPVVSGEVQPLESQVSPLAGQSLRPSEAPMITPNPVASPTPTSVPPAGENNFNNSENINMKRRPQNSWSFKLLLLAIVFFVLGGLFAAFNFFYGGNIVSSENIAIDVSMPLSIAAGEDFVYDLTIRNNNQTALEGTVLQIEYPAGTRLSGNLAVEEKRTSLEVGDLAPGAMKSFTLKTVLFGAEKETKTISFSLEYRLPGSSSLFNKNKSYDVQISSAPITVKVDGLKEVTAGQKLDYTVTVTSNSRQAINNLILRLESPYGYTLTDSQPKSLGKNVWSIGDLPPEGKKTVKLSGVLEGQNGEERVFRFTVGLQDTKDELQIATPFMVLSQSVNIQKPFFAVDLSFDGNTGDSLVTLPGKAMRVDVAWTNNLAEPIFDATMKIKLQGTGLNRSSVQVSRGYYDSINNTIILDPERISDLARVEPGQSGNTTFTLASYGSSQQQGNNPEITLDVSASARRTESGSVPEELLFSGAKKIRVATGLRLLTNTTFSNGPFVNTGPIPPQAEKETTYTVNWSLTNSTNDVTGAQVSAALPSYVTWLGQVSPATADISYNPVGGLIKWNAGDIKAGTGRTSSPTQVSFQVAVTPSLADVGEELQIVGPAMVKGQDTFIGLEVTETKTALTTRLLNDPVYSGESGVVQE